MIFLSDRDQGTANNFNLLRMIARRPAEKPAPGRKHKVPAVPGPTGLAS